MESKRSDQLDTALEPVYDEFIEPHPHNFYIGWYQFEGIIAENTDIDEDEIHDVWTIFEERYVHARPTKNGDLLNVSAFERVDELRDDVPISEELRRTSSTICTKSTLRIPTGPLTVKTS